MLITRIIAPSRQPNRRKIYLDGVLAFACHLNVVARFRLREGLALNSEQVSAIENGQVRQECFDYAMRSLQLRLHSRAELFKKLKRRDCSDAIIIDVLDQLTQLGYVNDAQFARAKAFSAAQHKHHGRRRANIELARAGIRGEIAEQALSAVYNQADSAATARLLVEKQVPRLRKLDPVVARRRLAAMLQRRGFEYETVKPIIDDVLGNREE